MGLGISIAVGPPDERDSPPPLAGPPDQVRQQVLTGLQAAGLTVHPPDADDWEEVDAQSDVLTVEVYLTADAGAVHVLEFDATPDHSRRGDGDAQYRRLLDELTRLATALGATLWDDDTEKPITAAAPE